ncbi:choice-of-anchor M domain-containing protein [Kineosporia sp. J2-2]|uniref:Choice-of-anchor M domain-containing protein n=1 Tax=Kineosporia corallincola TaxID=2835133 RepID=A0ABS5TT84_9ACTN|nr:choice-of-anchor M domain-containing protein [Kineosporia corallincola]MBT0774031.1 choice-of-anchor M domain-containing protein [Kineosporia corallincola]
MGSARIGRFLGSPGGRAKVAGALTAALGGALVLVTALAPSASAADWNGRLVLAQGHLDAVHLELEGSALSVGLREDITGNKVIRASDEVVIQVTDAARQTIPSDASYAFLGEAGDEFWLIPQVQDPDVVWAGWDTEEIETGDVRDDQVTLTLTNVSGPGSPVRIYSTGTFGQPTPLIDNLAGLVDITVPSNSHVHANWAFFEPGLYELTFQASAVTAAGTPVQGSATYQFVVGDLPSTDPEPTPTDPGSTPPPTTTPTTTASPTGSPTDPPAGGNSSVTQSIRATIGDDDGGLVLSVDPEDRSVILPAASLDPSGNHWSAGGELRPVTVTDTRTGSPGWNVAGQVSDFTGDTGQFPGKHLGWTPKILDQATGTAVTPGATVLPALTSGDGLAHSSTLAVAPAGTGRGVTVLGAGLELDVPAETETGSYEATLTLTVI